MMNHTLGAGTEFNSRYKRRNRRRGWELERNHKSAIAIRPGCGDGKWLGHFDDQIRLAQRPVRCKRRQRWKIGRVTLGGAIFGPRGKQFDFMIVQAVFPNEMAEIGGRLPR